MSQQASLAIDCDEKKVTRLVEVELSVAEHAQLHKDSQTKKAEIHDLDVGFKFTKDEYTAQNKKLQAELDAIIEKQSESREEECTQKTFFNNNTVEVWFGDKLIEERALTSEERQLSLGEAHHGVVCDPETDAPVTQEEFNQDMHETMKAERSKNKPSLVDERT